MSDKKKEHNSSEWLSADKPIQRREQDVLGRSRCAEALARAIRGWLGHESIVVALYGPWGNGKTSIKNMVVESIRSDSPDVLTVDFNPWQLVNRPTLSEAFFDELGIALGKGDLGSESLRKSLLARYQRWAQRLQGTRDFVQAVRTFMGTFLVVLGAAAIGASWIHSQVLTLLFGFFLILAGVLALASKFVDATIKLMAVGVEVGQKSLSEIKGEIARDLKKLKAPILVVLDDIDRLTPTEILEVIQLIKANADFPNLIYLILCERRVVEDNITKALNVSGRDYMEKIVQVGFDVPMIDVARVHQVLFERLNSLLSDKATGKHFSEQRWGNAFHSGLSAYFETLRDVNRFISTLSFHLASLSVDGEFEVNPIDLIILEVVRLYEPDVYRALQSNKELLTSNSRPEKPRSETASKALNDILQLGLDDHRDHLRELIRQLFPGIQWALGGSEYASEFEGEWYRDLRVCSSKMFDRYFRFSVSDEELSQSEVRRLLQARGDRVGLGAELRRLHVKGLLKLSIEELAVHQDEVEPHQVEAYVTALFDVADLLSDDKKAMFELPASLRVGFLVRKAIQKLPSGERVIGIENAMSRTAGLFTPVDFVGLVGAKRESTEKVIFEESELVRLREAAVDKIKKAALSDALAFHPKLGLLLGYWKQWGKAEDVKGYVEELTKTPSGTLLLLRSFVLRSLSHGMGDYVVRERYYMRQKDIEVAIPMNALAEKVQEISMESLNDEEKRAVTAFQKAQERRKMGKSDDDPFAVD